MLVPIIRDASELGVSFLTKNLVGLALQGRTYGPADIIYEGAPAPYGSQICQRTIVRGGAPTTSQNVERGTTGLI